MSGKHQAAILPQQGGPLSVVERTTPEPGPGEVLIEVKAVALNPVDHWQRDVGMPPVPSYPAVVGSDVAGLVAKVGSNVTDVPKVGSRAIAFASAFFQNGSPDHGAYQKYVLAQSEGVIPLPDALSFEQGAIFPLAVLTALSAWTTVGIPLETTFKPADKEAVLIWGGASSVGTLCIQSAKSMGYTVYATASTNNHSYLEKLGADAVFDYKASDVVSKIIDQTKKDGTKLRTANCVVSNCLEPTLEVLKVTKGDAVAKIAHTAVLPDDHPTIDGAEIKFTFPPMDKAQRDKHMQWCFHTWLHNGLKSGSIVPSPEIEVGGKGLMDVNKALDLLKGGVSLKKIVVPI